MISKALELKATSATWHGVPPDLKSKFTFVLIVSDFSHGVGDFPSKGCFSLLIE